MLGAYVRLSDAGLGCPDWPGCYGQLLGVPQSAAEVAAAFPDSRLDAGKAWREMAHRYTAALLGLLIFSMAALAWLNRRQPQQPLMLPSLLLALVILQAMLGMWTVTLLLKPMVVTMHLLGGMVIIAVLWQTLLRTHAHSLSAPSSLAAVKWLRPSLFIVLFLLFLQITLGGWTSSNYAALACLDFPTCQGQWWPPLDFAGALSPLFAETGQNFEFGTLDHAGRTTIHFMHRLGALLLTMVTTILLVFLFKKGNAWLRRLVVLAFALLFVQLALGAANVLFGLPLLIATAHNGVAALLVLSWLSVMAMVGGVKPGPSSTGC